MGSTGMSHTISGRISTEDFECQCPPLDEIFEENVIKIFAYLN